jgi:hypothetical protein
LSTAAATSVVLTGVVEVVDDDVADADAVAPPAERSAPAAEAPDDVLGMIEPSPTNTLTSNTSTARTQLNTFRSRSRGSSSGLSTCCALVVALMGNSSGPGSFRPERSGGTNLRCVALSPAGSTLLNHEG